MIALNLSRERTFFLWNVVGPFLALFTVLLMLYHSSPLTPYLGLILAFSLPLCWYLKNWTAVGVGVLLSFLLYFQYDLIQGQAIWHLGLVVSIVTTLFLTSRSFDEAQDMLKDFSGSSDDSKQEIEQLKTEVEQLKFKSIQETHAKQKIIDALSQELKINLDHKDRLEKSVEQTQNESLIAKNELDSARVELEATRIEFENSKIKVAHDLDELLDKRREVLELRDELAELHEELRVRPLEVKNEAIDSSESLKEVDELKELLSRKEQELFNTQFKLDSALEDIQTSESELVRLQNEEINQKNLNNEVADQLEIVKREKALLEQTLNKLQIENEHLQSSKEDSFAQQQSFNEVQQQLTVLQAKYKHELHLKEDELKNLQSRFNQIEGDKAKAVQSIEEANRKIKEIEQEWSSKVQDKQNLVEHLTIRIEEQKAHLSNQIQETENKNKDLHAKLAKIETDHSLNLDESTKLKAEIEERRVQAELEFKTAEKELMIKLQNEQELVKKLVQQIEEQKVLSLEEAAKLKAEIEESRLQIELEFKAAEKELINKLQKEQELVKHLTQQFEENKAGFSSQLKEFEQKREDLLAHQSQLKNELQVKLNHLEKTVREQEDRLKEQQTFIDHKNKEIEALQLKQIPSYHNLEAEDLKQEKSLRRRAEGMYNQLRDQFNEKSQTLDETRKTLFLTQETLMKLQNEHNENDLYHPNLEVQKLMRHILMMQKKAEEDAISHQEEIEHLEAIIAKSISV